MVRCITAVLYAIGGGIVLGALVFGGFFLLASLMGQQTQAALGMLVPMVLTPLAIVVGAVVGFWKGWQSKG